MEKHLVSVQRRLAKEMSLFWAPSGKVGMNRKEVKERDMNSRQKASLWELRGMKCVLAGLAQ